MRRLLSPLLVILLLIFCAGCDGYIRTIHFVKPGDARPSWSASSTAVEVSGNEDIPGIMLQVAKDLKMKEEKPNRWYTETMGKSTFTLLLKKSKKEIWTVNLIDFPTTSRSDESKQAEEEICNLLKKAQRDKVSEQAVIVHVPLSDGKHGTKEEFNHLLEFEKKLEARIIEVGVGELDGNEFGQGDFTYFMYGRDADQLFAAVEPLLRSDLFAKKGRVDVRYGGPGAAQREVELSR